MNRDTVITSSYVGIAAASVIVPTKVRDNEKCPFSGSNHFLLWVDFFFELYSSSYSTFVKEEVHC